MDSIQEEIENLRQSNKTLWKKMMKTTWMVIYCHILVFALGTWLLDKALHINVLIEMGVAAVATYLFWLIIVPLRRMWREFCFENWKQINKNKDMMIRLSHQLEL